MASALEGVRIIELAQGVAGPYTGMLLAEQGAEVIKVEPPQGDKARGTPGFHVWNRSKRSVFTDPTTRKGGHAPAVTRHRGCGIIDTQPGEEENSACRSEIRQTQSPTHLLSPSCFRQQRTACAPLPGGYARRGGQWLLGSQWSHRDGGVHLVIPIASYGAAFVACTSIAAALYERTE